MPGQKPDPRLDPPALTPSSGLAKLGPRALLAASLVHALSKAARAFTLYEPSNALIRQFLAEYRARADAATAGGPLAVDVSPYELRSEGEVVYREEDRERSLAFRLYRDGIRRVTFSPEPPFEELLRFLEILAIRFTGIRQAEDDVVTLLRKAALGAIEVVAVEEYTADEAEPQGRPGHDTRPPLELDPRFDTPAPRLPAPRPIAQREVPEAAVARLRREEDPATVVGSALALAEELLALGTSGSLPAEEVTRFCAELRDYLWPTARSRRSRRSPTSCASAPGSASATSSCGRSRTRACWRWCSRPSRRAPASCPPTRRGSSRSCRPRR